MHSSELLYMRGNFLYGARRNSRPRIKAQLQMKEIRTSKKKHAPGLRAKEDESD
jgi:hypothetical protein